MLNNSINNHAFITNNKKYIFIIFSILLAACSATQKDTTQSNKINTINPEANAVFIQAISAMKSHEYKKAKILLEKAIILQPDFSRAFINLSIIQANDKNYKEAEKSLITALKSSPDDIHALNQLGFVYRELGEFTKALASYKKAINTNPDYAIAHYNIGILYDLYLYDLPQALTHYKKYQQLTHDTDPKVTNWIVDIERRHKKSLAIQKEEDKL